MTKVVGARTNSDGKTFRFRQEISSENQERIANEIYARIVVSHQSLLRDLEPMSVHEIITELASHSLEIEFSGKKKDSPPAKTLTIMNSDKGDVMNGLAYLMEDGSVVEIKNGSRKKYLFVVGSAKN